MNPRNLVPRIAILALPLAAVSCFGGGVKTGADVKPINAVGTITAAEWVNFAEEMRTSMMQHGVLNRYKGEDGMPVPLMIGDFFNNTNDPAFTYQRSVMYNELRKGLVNTGQCQVLADAGGTGAEIDRSVGDADQLHSSDAYDPSTLAPAGQAVGPKLTLSGSFVRIAYAEGMKKQADYAVDLRLIDNRTKLTIWEEQIVFSKQGRRGPGSGKVIGQP